MGVGPRWGREVHYTPLGKGEGANHSLEVPSFALPCLLLGGLWASTLYAPTTSTTRSCEAGSMGCNLRDLVSAEPIELGDLAGQRVAIDVFLNS